VYQVPRAGMNFLSLVTAPRVFSPPGSLPSERLVRAQGISITAVLLPEGSRRDGAAFLSRWRFESPSCNGGAFHRADATCASLDLVEALPLFFRNPAFHRHNMAVSPPMCESFYSTRANWFASASGRQVFAPTATVTLFGAALHKRV